MTASFDLGATPSLFFIIESFLVQLLTSNPETQQSNLCISLTINYQESLSMFFILTWFLAACIHLRVEQRGGARALPLLLNTHFGAMHFSTLEKKWNKLPLGWKDVSQDRIEGTLIFPFWLWHGTEPQSSRYWFWHVHSQSLPTH